jgi:hypothetical protein
VKKSLAREKHETFQEEISQRNKQRKADKKDLRNFTMIKNPEEKFQKFTNKARRREINSQNKESKELKGNYVESHFRSV